MAKPIEATEPVEGEDAERLLEDLKKVCSPEEMQRRKAAAREFMAQVYRPKGEKTKIEFGAFYKFSDGRKFRVISIAHDGWVTKSSRMGSGSAPVSRSTGTRGSVGRRMARSCRERHARRPRAPAHASREQGEAAAHQAAEAAADR